MSSSGSSRRARTALAAALALAAAGSVAVDPGAAAGSAHDRAGGSVQASASAPSVRVMVVGAGNVVLSPARSIGAGAATVRAGRRSCGVAAGTPLAALADLHLAGGPGFAVRDYGRCSSSPRDSGQLFVYSLDGETNHGQNGWEYKVGNRSGTTGAGDPTGAQGDGRLLAPGSQVLWFWCQAFAGGCQRNLALSAPGSLPAGGVLRVRVTGYDNYGRGAAMSGARVRLGGASAVSGASGTVTLRAPARSGSYALTASRPGSVPAFPVSVTVR